MKGKYFLYEPNKYYHDVVIEEDRLRKLPINHSDVQGLPIVLTNNSEQDLEQDLGPAPNQFDALELDEEVTSCSGFAAQLTGSDADENIKNILKKFLGKNACEWKETILNGGVAEMPLTITQTRDKPIPELTTDGFFTMAYPHIFINGTCDISIKSMNRIFIFAHC